MAISSAHTGIADIGTVGPRALGLGCGGQGSTKLIPDRHPHHYRHIKGQIPIHLHYHPAANQIYFASPLALGCTTPM